MSKSDPQTMATISVTDTPDDIALKIRRAVTDFTSEVTFDPETRPGVSNLVNIHAAVAMISVQEAVSQARGLDTGAYKKLVSEAVIQRLTPIREEIERLRSDRAYVERVLAQGTCRARELAAPVLAEVRQRVGFCWETRKWPHIYTVSLSVNYCCWWKKTQQSDAGQTLQGWLLILLRVCPQWNQSGSSSFDAVVASYLLLLMFYIIIRSLFIGLLIQAEWVSSQAIVLFLSLLLFF